MTCTQSFDPRPCGGDLLIYKEDDRSHKMWYNMGCCMFVNMYFGIAMILPAGYDRARIGQSFDTLPKAHPFLNAVLGYEENENRYFYDVRESSHIQTVFVRA